MFESAASFSFFDTTGGTVQVVYRPTGGNMYLNGFEIDSESQGRQIRYPLPQHRDDSVEAEDDAVAASWQPTFNVDGGTYNVYFGTSPDELEKLVMDLYDPEITFSGKWPLCLVFLWEFPRFNHNLVGLSSGTTYYWRVDVTETFYGDVYFGRVWTFTVA